MHFLRTMIKYSMEIDGMNVLSIFIISFEICCIHYKLDHFKYFVSAEKQESER